MSKKLFVGNLSFQTTERDISDMFAQYGAVESVQIITDRDTGRSKGFGFVVMDQEGADKAIAALNGSQVEGRALTVNEAKPMVKREFGGGGSRGGGRDRRWARRGRTCAQQHHRLGPFAWWNQRRWLPIRDQRLSAQSDRGA